jgi:PAS domain S-box-containing protein
MSTETAMTEKLITQEKINASDFLNLTTELFSVIVLFFNVKNKSVQYSPHQICTELGYDEQECESEYFDLNEIIHPDDLKQMNKVLEQLGKGELLVPVFRCRFLQKNGSYLVYNVKARTKQAENTVVLLATRADELKQQSDKISELERIKNETERILLFGTFEYNVLEDTAKWSGGLYELFGYKEERPAINFNALIGHLQEEKREEQRGRILQVMNTANDYTEELDIVTKDGVSKRIQIVGRRLYNSQNEPIKDIGLMRDVTQKRRQEEELRNAIDELQRSNKELEEFAYVASHDLQEPLRKISTFSGRLMERFDETLKDEGKLYLERIMASAGNMRTLIDNLLEFSRISRTKQPFVPLNLNFVLHQVKSDLELNIEETETRIDADSLPVIDGSLSQMKQLFNNIINNAIKFRKPGEVPVIDITSSRLSLESRQRFNLDRAKNYCSIRFTDNGIGFESEYATRIFQIFQRLHGKSEYPGSGIGLAICKKIVDRHHGSMFAENIEGRGACFTVILPCKEKEVI